jgi:thimet oligopeptidase
MKKISLALTCSVALVVGCSSGTKPIQNTGEPALIKYDYQPKEITALCDSQMKVTSARVDEVLKIPVTQKNFTNTIEALETILADLSDITTPANFMYYVSLNKDLRAEAEQCESNLGQYIVGLTSRRDIYNAVVKAKENSQADKLNQPQRRLIEETMKSFRKNGLFLPDAELKVVRELRQKLATLETQFASNLNESVDSVSMTKDDLDGVPQSMINRLEKDGDKFKVTTKSTDYIQFMENAKSSDARKRLAEKYENVAAEKNTKLLEEAVKLRRDIAHRLKFETWADYRTEDRMAKNAKTVWTFLNGLEKKLEAKNAEDMAQMLKVKKEMEPGSSKLDAWDVRYYANQLKKRDYAVDEEVVREYFPSERTVEKMFEVYSTLLGVKFIPQPKASTWAPDVKLYEIRDSKDNHFIGNFFTDFIPRPGKYGHAAAFTLHSGRMINGQYSKPISAIVANFNPPSNGRPSLLSHDEVETLFHEFGHIMHQTLTKAPYSSLSGSSVAQDFVEAPSQMLENWVWDPGILKMISGHYQNIEEKMPDDLIAKLVKTRDFNRGYFYTRQLLFGIYDMTLHTSEKDLDPTTTYRDLYKKIATIDPVPNTHFPATFGHLMGGYDAGYYGYLWSEVFAEDMFTQFEKAGLLNSKVGRRYRDDILEQGDVYPADKLLVNFLGRKPNNKAFFKRLGIK